MQAPDFAAARAIALRLYEKLRGSHDWGRRFDPRPGDAVLDRMAEMAPREMRRAWMTAFGNARLAQRDTLLCEDLPSGNARKARIGFMQ